MPTIKISEKISEPQYATKCLICGEGVPIHYPNEGPRICNECRRAVLAIRKQYKIKNVKLPEEE